MVSREIILWDVDTQVDFMLPGGKLHVPGAETIIPHLRRLVDAARQAEVFVVSSADAHTPQDEEFREWPLHCLKGTPGQQKIPETLTDKFLVVPNRPAAELPASLDRYQQVIVEKQKLDVFTNPNIEAVLERLGSHAEFVVFGVVTEYCVRCAAAGLLERGRRVAIVTDAIRTLDPTVGQHTLEELTAKGARLVTTEPLVALLGKPATRGA